MRWITFSAARRQLGMNAESLDSIVRMGILEARDVPRGRLVNISADDDGPAILARLYEKHGRCQTLADFQRIRDAGLILLGKRRAVPPPTFTEDAFDYMDRKGIKPSTDDLRSLTGATQAVAKDQILEWFSRSGGHAGRSRTHVHVTAADHEAAVMARLPDALKDAPGTFLCPRFGHPDGKPQDSEFATLNAISDERLFAGTALTIFYLAANGTKPGQRRRLLTIIRDLNARFPETDFNDPFSVRRALETMLGPKWATDGRSDGNAAENVNRYHLIHQHFQTYLTTAVPAERRPSLARYSITLPAGHGRFFRCVRDDVRRYQSECTASRQNRIEKILDEPLAFLLVGRLRLKEHQELRDVCRSAIDKQIGSGRPLREPFRFQHTYEARLYSDRLRACRQTAYFALWSWDLLHDRMHEANDELGRRRRSYGENADTRNDGRNAYAVEFLGVAPAEPDGPCQVPLMAQVADSFILDEIASLNERQRERRDQACADWAFPRNVPAMPGGLPHFVWSRRHTAREANKLLTSVKCNGERGPVLLVAPEEFTHGLMFAHAALGIVSDAGCRTGEVLQAPSKRSGYKAVTDQESGDVFKSFSAVGKFGLNVSPLLSPDTFRHVTDLVIENADRWHGGKMPPAVPPNHHLAQMIGSDSSHFAFTVDARMLNVSELGTLLRVLYLGWHDLQGHDVRHVFNGMSRRAGISRETRQRLLNHGNPQTTDRYGPATATELHRHQMALHHHNAEKAASLLRAAAGGSSARMLEADRELRRAALVLQFYVAEGSTDLATVAREEVNRWADELAKATAAHTGGSEVIRVDAL